MDRLLGRTYDLLDSVKGKMTQQQIADGAGVTLTWLQKLVRGAIPDPGVERIQKVHDYLVSIPDEAA